MPLVRRCTYRLRKVTITKETFLQVSVRFLTEHHLVDTMQNVWRCMLEDTLSGLASHVAKSKVTPKA